MEIRKYSLIAKLLLLSMACCVAQSRTVKDKSELYKRYPQLLSTETDPCVKGLNQLFINMNTNLTAETMAFQSMHGLADLGRKKECENGDMADFASYSTLNLNISHIPV